MSSYNSSDDISLSTEVEKITSDASMNESSNSTHEEFVSYTNYNDYDEKLTPIIDVEIIDGYTFKQFMEFAYGNLTSIPLMFSEDGISILHGNASGSVIIQAHLESIHLRTYNINMTHFNNPHEGIHIINPELRQFMSWVKSITRKNPIRIISYAEKPNIIYAYNQSAKTGSVESHICCMPYEHKEYDLGEFAQDLKSPNCKIPLSELTSTCADVKRVNCRSCVFKCFPRGVTFEGKTSTGSVGKIRNWGNVQPIKKIRFPFKDKAQSRVVTATIEPNEIQVRMDTIKTLSKINSINTNGLVLLYNEDKNVVRLYTKLGAYGNIMIYLTSISDSDMTTTKTKAKK